MLVFCGLFPRHIQATPKMQPEEEDEMMFGDSNDDHYDDHDLTTE